MKVSSINAYQANSNGLTAERKNYQGVSTSKSMQAQPSFGWFGIDDLFYYFRKRLNQNRQEERDRQISEVRRKIADDTAILAKRLKVPAEAAAKEYENYLKIGSIKQNYSGNEVGLNRVMGYSLEKLELIKNAVVPIVLSLQYIKHDRKLPEGVVVPNGILLYGPSGTGKSFMLESLSEHFKEIAKEKNLPIKLAWIRIDSKISAKILTKEVRQTFEEIENLDRNTHGIVLIEGLDELQHIENGEELNTELKYQMYKAAQKGHTWIAASNWPKDLPKWIFKPEILTVSECIDKISDPESSAVMSYFWAQKGRKDESDHNVILNHMANEGRNIYPPQFKDIANLVEKSLCQYDKEYKNSPRYMEPVNTQEVVGGIDAYYWKKKLGDQKLQQYMEGKGLDSSDEKYVREMMIKLVNGGSHENK